MEQRPRSARPLDRIAAAARRIARSCALLAPAACAWAGTAHTAPPVPSAPLAHAAPGTPAAQAGTQAPHCASGPERDTYVSLRADTPSELAALVAGCERLGYRRIGGVAHAVVANPGAASAQLYFQVMIVPAGAASTPAPAASASR